MVDSTEKKTAKNEQYKDAGTSELVQMYFENGNFDVAICDSQLNSVCQSMLM